MSSPFILRRLWLLALGVVMVGLVPCAAQQMLRNSFESNRTFWVKGTADAAFEETTHTLSDQVAHDGQRSEYLQINAKQGSHIYYYYPAAKAPIADDLTASLWVKSTRPGIQLLARLVLPKEADPSSLDDRLVVMLKGDVYKTAGTWQQLEIPRPVKLANQVQQQMQAQFKRPINFEGAYIDKLVLNVYGGPGVTDLWIDELELGPVLDSATPKTPTPAGPADVKPAPSPKAVEFNGSSLQVDGKRFVFRGIRLTTTPVNMLGQLRRAGINTLFVDYPWNPDILRDAVEQGFLLAPSLPVAVEDARAVSMDNFVRNFPEPESVLFWNLGTALADEQYMLVGRKAQEILAADRHHVLGLDAWDGLARYSNTAHLLSLHRWPLGTTMELTQYKEWLESRSRLANPGTFLWTWIQTHTPEWYTQLLYNQSADKKFTDPVGPQPEQVRLLTYLAVGSGFRGIGYWSDMFLDDNHHGADRLLTIALLNQELEFLEPLLTCADGSPTWIDTSDGNIKAAILRTTKGILVLPMWLGDHSQFVPGQAAVSKLTMTVPLVPPSFQCWELSPGDVRSLKPTLGDSGGMKITLPEFGLTTALVFTSDIALIQQFQKLCYARRKLASEFTKELARIELQKVLRVQELLEKDGHSPQDAGALLKDADERLKTAESLWETHQFSLAYREAQRALRPVRILMRAQWDKGLYALDEKLPLDSPTSSPYLASFYTLPQHWQLMSEVKDAKAGANLLPVGDFEVVPGRAEEKWLRQEYTLDDAVTDVKLVSELPFKLPPTAKPDTPKVLLAKQGRQFLVLEIKPKPGTQPPRSLERTYIALTSPSVQLPPGSLVRVSGWMAVPDPIQASADGALFYDNAGGEPLAVRQVLPTMPPPNQPSPVATWKQFTLYRRVPASGTINVTLTLTGLGRVAFDDIRIEPLGK
jgi:hypothetical protein